MTDEEPFESENVWSSGDAEAPEEMDAQEEVPPPTPKEGTYRICVACGMYWDPRLESCPECGAYDDEVVPPIANRNHALILSITLVLMLGLSLIVMTTSPQESEGRVGGLPSFHGEGVAWPNPTPTPETVMQPLATPTPAPRPTATPWLTAPTPQPTATPFIPAATPTPRPTPTPAPPTPTPTPKKSRTLELKEQLMEEFRVKLDETHPMAGPGDFVRLTLGDGRIVSGTIVRKDNTQLLLETPVGRTWIVYRNLMTESRIRVDEGERNARLEEKALQEVLRRLQN